MDDEPENIMLDDLNNENTSLELTTEQSELIKNDENDGILNDPVSDNTRMTEHSITDDEEITEQNTGISRIEAEGNSDNTAKIDDEDLEYNDRIEGDKKMIGLEVDEVNEEISRRSDQEIILEDERTNLINEEDNEETQNIEIEESIERDQEDAEKEEVYEEETLNITPREGIDNEESRFALERGETDNLKEERSATTIENEEHDPDEKIDNFDEERSTSQMEIEEEKEKSSIKLNEDLINFKERSISRSEIEREEGSASLREIEEIFNQEDVEQSSKRQSEKDDDVTIIEGKEYKLEVELSTNEQATEDIDNDKEEKPKSKIVNEEINDKVDAINKFDNKNTDNLEQEPASTHEDGSGVNEEKINKEYDASDLFSVVKSEVKENEENNVNKGNQIGNDNDIISDSQEMEEREEIDQNSTVNKIKFDDIQIEGRQHKQDGVSIFFTVHITLDDGSIKNQLVTIVKPKTKKPFLGGYRHKISGLEYHHSAVQTAPKPRLPSKVQLFSRDTQTFQLKHQKINTDNTTTTQMTMPGIFVSNIFDKLLSPKEYETADKYQERILENIVVIQKYYRRWLAKQVVDEKRKQRDDRLQWEQDDKDRKQREKEERIKNEYNRRMHPKTKADFDLLYSDLEKWRHEQLTAIDNSDLTIAEKKVKKVLLLEEETDLLAAIDRHKIDRKEETKHDSVQKVLGKAAAPKSWKDPKGRKIEMDTQFTIRSRELLEIFNSLNMQYLTPDERLDVLLTLKHTVKEHDCKLTKDIVDLIDREADLIMRNLKDSSLAGLRKRISTLFLQYCKTPTFNPQISLLLRVPSDSSTLVGDINYCKYCGRYLRSTEFSLSTKSAKLTICKSCARKDNQSRNRQDYSHYRRILKEIQMNEQKVNDGSKIAFIFKQNDVKSLIEGVWDGKSIISSCEDLDELVFLRWDLRDHWSPWNTVFLTKDEAEAHVKVTNLSDTYSHVLINRIVQKHVIARNIFGSLVKMVTEFQAKTSMLPVEV